MNFNLDFINNNLPKITRRLEVSAPVDTFLQDVLFGDPRSDMGNEANDGFIMEWRRYAPQVAKEAIRGADPERLNYQSKFNADLFTPSYYHNEEEVNLSDADARIFGEDLSENVSTARRVLVKYAEKRDALDDAFILAKEKMCADMLISAKVTNKAGEQAFPMTGSLLSLTGSTMYSDFLGTIKGGVEAVRKKNKAFRPDCLILNPTYAGLLIGALKTAGLLDKECLNLGKVHFEGILGNGAELQGAVNAPGAPILYIVAYYGCDSSDNYYIPDQKAFFGRLEKGSVGGFGYGRVRAYENGVPQYKVVKDRTVAAVKGYGDMRVNIIEKQSAPLPTIHNIDGYGIFTSIPSSLS